MTLTIAQSARLAPGQPARRTLDRGSLSIGRGDSNDWVLVDADRVISKRHCVIEGDGTTYRLTDKSTNGTFLNDEEQPIGFDVTRTIASGDRILISDVVVRVEVDESGAVEAFPKSASFLDPGLTEFRPEDLNRPQEPLASLGPTVRPPEQDPFAGFDLQDLGPSSEPGPPAAPAREQPPRGEKEEAPGRADLERGSPTDAFFAPPPAAPQQSHAPADLIPENWMDLGGAEPNAPPPQTPPPESLPPPPTFEPTPLPAFEPVVPPPVTPPPQAPSQGGVAPSFGGADLAAFLAGAGLSPEQVQLVQSDETLRSLGQIFRTVVQGTMDVLAARRAMQQEVRAEVTEFRAARNNPLKFSLGVDDAMVTLLSPDKPGYLPAVEAFGEAFDDIKRHELAVLAGMQETWMDLLKRFDPEALAAKLGEDSGISGLLTSKKARCWDAFTQIYATVTEEADGRFGGLFGQKFGRAYQAQSKRDNR